MESDTEDESKDLHITSLNKKCAFRYLSRPTEDGTCHSSMIYVKKVHIKTRFSTTHRVNEDTRREQLKTITKEEILSIIINKYNTCTTKYTTTSIH